jgi:hypothetical protein
VDPEVPPVKPLGKLAGVPEREEGLLEAPHLEDPQKVNRGVKVGDAKLGGYHD